jgi:histidinol dehydrogenase
MALTRVIEDLEEARRTLLAQRSLGSGAVPESMRARLRSIFGRDLTPEAAVQQILADVRAKGDAALIDYTARIDGRRLEAVELDLETARSIIEASVLPSTYDALRAAAEEIRTFHERARRNTWVDFQVDSARGQLIRPLRRVGVYAPGGRAPYPSTVLMAAIPARVAGVEEIALVSPPQPSGTIAPVILAAAEIAEIDRIFQIGGAQAIAALAYGTESVPRVDKIVGPGNLFVVLAKRAVYGEVGIDGVPGPTECLIVADETANVSFLAADFVAQAEHDELAKPVLLCTSRQVADAVLAETERLVESAARRDIVLASLRELGAVVVHPNVDELIELANEFAPEHLALSVNDAWSKLPLVRNAGGVFVGDFSAESIGDYTAGPSHIMPTNGTARFNSPLNLDDFLKITSIFAYGPREVERIGPPAIAIARAEGLEAHARAIEVRLESLNGPVAEGR